jgi:hypothetical protein
MSTIGRDVDLDSENNGEPLTVLTLLEELRGQGERAVDTFAIKAQRNELYVQGKQYLDIDTRSGAIDDLPPLAGNAPQIHHNLLRNLVLTWTQRLTSARPSATAFPATAEAEDMLAADTASKLIEHMENEFQVDEMLFDIVELACSHGIGGIKVFYDPLTEKVVWEPISIFDFYIDPTNRTSDAGWVVFRSFISEERAKVLYDAAGIKESPPVVEYTINELEAREGVEAYEIWYRPNSRIPKGLYAKIVGGSVVDQMDYPYMFNDLDRNKEEVAAKLPISLFHVNAVRGTCYGDTWMNDAVPLQRQINEIESVLTKLRRDTGGVRLVAPGDVVDAWEDDNHMIRLNDPAKAQMIRWIPPPEVSGLLFEDRDRLEKRLYDIAGLNEMLVGVESAKSGTSAKQIAYLAQLDSMKHAGTARSIEAFLLRVWELTLNLIQRYYTYPRLVSIVGEDGKMLSMDFVGADVNGIDIRLEPRAGAERMHAQKAQNIVERAQQGLEDPASVPERSLTGVELTSEQSNKIEQINDQIEMVMAGQQSQPIEDLDPSLASQIISQTLSVLQRHGEAEEVLAMVQQLKQMYDEKAASLMRQQNEMRSAAPSQQPETMQ